MQCIDESFALTATGIRLGKKRVNPVKQWGEHNAKQQLKWFWDQNATRAFHAKCGMN